MNRGFMGVNSSEDFLTISQCNQNSVSVARNLRLMPFKTRHGFKQQISTGFSIKLISNFSTPMPTTKGDFVASIESYYSVVCQSKLVRLNRQILLTGPMGTGNILAAAQAIPTWKPADTTLLFLIDALCK